MINTVCLVFHTFVHCAFDVFFSSNPNSMRIKRLVLVCLMIVIFLTTAYYALTYFQQSQQDISQYEHLRFSQFALSSIVNDSFPTLDKSIATNKGSKNVQNRHAKVITRELRRLANSQLSDKNPSQKLERKELLSLLSDMTLLLETKLTGSNYVDGQAANLVQQLDAVEKLVKDRLLKLQYPQDCKEAKFLIADVSKACGFACRAHHWSYCLSISYALNRTLYLPNEFEDAEFQPVTHCKKPASHLTHFNVAKSEDKVVYCPIIDGISSELLPPALTHDLVNRLEGLHGYPSIWFLGQLLSFIFRLKPSKFKIGVQRNINNLRSEQSTRHYRQPVAGVHIRRTDKINTEAAFYELSDYMIHVEHFFRKKALERRIATKDNFWFDDIFSPPSEVKSLEEKPRVFIASDDPNVIKEARIKYPQYHIIGEEMRASSAAVGKRSSKESIQDIIMDVLMLSNTDFLSCTFSSQVCRVAYELMQSHHAFLGDASANVESLDSLYYFGGQQKYPWGTMMDFPSRGIKLDDRFYVFPNYWNGFADVENAKTKEKMRNVPAFLFYPLPLRIPAT